MPNCLDCGKPIGGDRVFCDDCRDAERYAKAREAAQIYLEAQRLAERRTRRNKQRRDREQVMKDLGLKKVKGNLGGTYWE